MHRSDNAEERVGMSNELVGTGANQVRLNAARVAWSRWRLIFFWSTLTINLMQVFFFHHAIDKIAADHSYCAASVHRTAMRSSFEGVSDVVWNCQWRQHIRALQQISAF